MQDPSTRPRASVETATSRRLVMMLEDIPMWEVRTIAVQYDYKGLPIVTRESLAAVAEPGAWGQPGSSWTAHGLPALRPEAGGRVIGVVSRNDLMTAIGAEVAA